MNLLQVIRGEGDFAQRIDEVKDEVKAHDMASCAAHGCQTSLAGGSGEVACQSGTLTCILDSGVLDFQMAAVPSGSCALVPAGGQGQAPLVSPHLDRMLQRKQPQKLLEEFWPCE